ncbi:hypothetical protein [Pseudorhodoferax sp.]|uniref:hypothetical protein n=1 Tax=Pseudorhodoferax sp. TaxID=1993553 RepID=UPI0039E46522
MPDLVAAAAHDLPPLQAEFHRLSDALAAERARLEHWQQASSDFQQQLAAATAPLRAQLRAVDRSLLLFLDHAADQANLGRSDLRLLHALARDIAAMLLRDGDDAELRALHQRHLHAAPEPESTPPPPDDDTPAAAAPLPDDGEDWMAAWERLEQDQHATAHARQRERERRKGEARRQRRAALPRPEEGSRTLREVYRRLASALHPDRESDPAERARKTALMQRANRAYEAGRLVDLLQLQMETAQIDAQAVARMGEDALRRASAVLAEQLGELRQEAADTEAAYRRLLKLGHGAEATPARVARALKEQVRALQQDVAYYEWERQALQDDPRMLKEWLREQG